MSGPGNAAAIEKAKWDIKQCLERVRGAIRDLALVANLSNDAQQRRTH